MNARPARARTHSLCGTMRRIAAESPEAARAARLRCRHAAVWSCRSSADCSKRMADQRR